MKDDTLRLLLAICIGLTSWIWLGFKVIGDML